MRGAAEGGGRGALLLLLLVVATASALLLGRPAVSSPATFRLCGKKLADLLSLVCRERGFYDPFAQKPAYARVPAGEPYRENRVGVSDECCRRGCTEATLKSYCAPSEDDYSDTELEFVREDQQVAVPSRGGGGGEVAREAESSPTAGVSSGPKVSRRGGKRRKGGGGGGGGRKRGGARARWPRGGGGGGKGRKCRCRRRRRKTDSEALKRQMTHTSFQIGTIPPSFLGTPVILSRTRVYS